MPEAEPPAALLESLPDALPFIHIDAVAGDAAFGYPVFLLTIYRLGARRLVDLRPHATDKDKSLWPVRGYDDRGRPVCPWGYALCSNGFDRERQRHKWICCPACRHEKEPLVSLPGVAYPSTECPYAIPQRPLGLVVSVDQRFADGSTRLVRDLPVGSPQWKRLYYRARNAVEGRNAYFQSWNLKRLPVYGLPRASAVIFLADAWSNLLTMARLMREATLASGGT